MNLRAVNNDGNAQAAGDPSSVGKDLGASASKKVMTPEEQMKLYMDSLKPSERARLEKMMDQSEIDNPVIEAGQVVDLKDIRLLQKAVQSLGNAYPNLAWLLGVAEKTMSQRGSTTTTKSTFNAWLQGSFTAEQRMLAMEINQELSNISRDSNAQYLKDRELMREARDEIVTAINEAAREKAEMYSAMGQAKLWTSIASAAVSFAPAAAYGKSWAPKFMGGGGMWGPRGRPVDLNSNAGKVGYEKFSEGARGISGLISGIGESQSSSIQSAAQGKIAYWEGKQQIGQDKSAVNKMQWETNFRRATSEFREVGRGLLDSITRTSQQWAQQVSIGIRQ